MNQLSWLIYLADVAGSLGGWLVFAGAAGGAACIVAIGAVCASLDEFMDDDDRTSTRKFAGRVAGWAIPFLIIGVVGSAALPSRETVYAIAASEMGEQALASPTAVKAFAALDAWLDAQITPAKDPA